MKKIIAITILTLSLGSNAYWGNNNGYNDNGLFGFNQHSYFDPRWYFKEAGNMMDEFDNTNNGYRNYSPYSYGYNRNYNQSRINPMNYMMTPYGPGKLPN